MLCIVATFDSLDSTSRDYELQAQKDIEHGEKDYHHECADYLHVQTNWDRSIRRVVRAKLSRAPPWASCLPDSDITLRLAGELPAIYGRSCVRTGGLSSASAPVFRDGL